jgi:hypothetical protein
MSNTAIPQTLLTYATLHPSFRLLADLNRGQGAVDHPLKPLNTR